MSQTFDDELVSSAGLLLALDPLDGAEYLGEPVLRGQSRRSEAMTDCIIDRRRQRDRRAGAPRHQKNLVVGPLGNPASEQGREEIFELVIS